MEGLGDAVEWIISKTVPEKFVPKNCQGCANRKKSLNRVKLPYVNKKKK